MHLRLCLFQARFRLIGSAVLSAAATLLATVPVAFRYQAGAWRLVRAASESEAAKYWRNGTDNAAMVLLAVLLFVAADLGATALGDDASHNTFAFLLTRPRSRRYFLWSSWTAGVLGLLLVLAVSAASTAATLWFMSGTLLPGRLLTQCVVLFATAASMLSLAFLLSIATRSALGGYQLAGSALALYCALRYFLDPAVARYRSIATLFDWTSADAIPAMSILLLLLMAISLPVVAQLRFAQRDI